MAGLVVLENEAVLAAEAAERLTTLIERSIAARGSATVCLTGGSTPRRLYSLLASPEQPWRTRIDWTSVHLFWGDERHVPPDHPESNYGMARDTLVAHVPIPAAQVHRMRGEIEDAAAAAEQYIRELGAGFAAAGRSDRRWDVMLLGLGEDAHIASIFPGSSLIAGEDEAPAAAVWAPHLNAWRITLTPGAILDAYAIVMVAAGAAKAGAVHAALEAPDDVTLYPAQLLRSAGERVTWVLDRAAAAGLTAR